MSGYGKGAALERRVRDEMRERGWLAVRAAGSHTPVDVYCIAKDALVFVQCKYSGTLSPAEWNELMDVCERVGAVPVMAEKARVGVAYHRLDARKDGKGGRQPMSDWEPPRVEEEEEER